MQNDWINTQDAQNIIGQFDERRPAWLWSGDGQTLIWQNRAARLFLAKQKKCRIKLAKPAVPIRGQVRRLLRLGSIGLNSLARVQFMVGNKPVSATCSCMPLVLENNDTGTSAGLLIVGVDPIEAEIFETANLSDEAANLSDIDETGKEKAHQGEDGQQGEKDNGDKEALPEQVFETSGNDDAGSHGDQTSAKKAGQSGQLSNILDQLANNSQLFAPLDASDEIIPDELKWNVSGEEKTGGSTFEPEKQDDAEAKITKADDRQASRDENKEISPPPAPLSGEQKPLEQKPLWQVRGAGFVPLKANRDQSGEPLNENGNSQASEQTTTDNSGDNALESQSARTSETIKADRVASYNFKELSRILKSRINSEKPSEKPRQGTSGPQAGGAENAGKTLNLSEEMLVLNRLPVGILIFRDQQILFANRAFADLMGSASISRLHEGGLDGLFPQIGNADAPVGPVVSLVKLDGKQVLVDARLQTITWQGASALMLSASEQNNEFDAEASVKSFTRSLAQNREQGYFETNDAGVVTFISETGAELLEKSTTELSGSAISALVDGGSLLRFQGFLRQKAQFAGAARPYIVVDCAGKNLEMEIFSQGRAGIVTGYFGLIRAKDSSTKIERDADRPASDSPLLARLSRGIRRPLNTILGFSELIYSEAFGALGNPRYGEYARDIKSAGAEIARLVDEMDEYSHLRDENFVPDSADFDLGQLLQECLRLVRSQANKRRVFVRSAISETLPAICADRASMRQAILNLLASAIDQSPAGGKVILSAQIEDDGSIGVHVRDSAQNPNAASERFVVFRESNSRRGEAMVAMKSSMGLALTRSLLAVNDCALHVDPSVGAGTLMSLNIPAAVFGTSGGHNAAGKGRFFQRLKF